MGSLTDLAINLLAAAIGVTVGWLWNSAYRAFKLRHARKFWRRFTAETSRLVVGRFLQFPNFEPSGLIGAGDASALIELKTFFEKMGLGQIEVHYSDQIDGDLLQANLILVGGPEANLVTREAVVKMIPALEFGYPDRNAIAFYDFITRKEYLPWTDLISGEITRDFGIILSAPNPFAPATRIIVIAGSFGYGTRAALRFALSKNFWEHPLVMKGLPVECLLEYRRGQRDATRDTRGSDARDSAKEKIG